MDWSKVDAGLAGALADDAAGRRYLVFVHFASEPAAGALAALGVEGAGEGLVRTASVSALDVDRLSDLAEVRHVRLSSRLGLSEQA